MNIAYWTWRPLENRDAMTLRLKALGLLTWNERRFETALLIAEKCLEGDGITVTDKGWDAIDYYFRNTPLQVKREP